VAELQAVAPESDSPPVELDRAAKMVTLGIVILAAFIVVLDNTVLNVAIPTILHDFHTTLPTLEWVITGYALTFATLLIIGGRLGDIYGHRRIFIIGAALFGVGSLIASISTSVGQLIVGEAIIEGIGASFMLPATLAILSDTFRGRERASAFAAWGATAGVAAASGPVVGGFLTTNYSWRWSFRINVIIAPLAIIGALLFMRRGERSSRRPRIDFPGALLIAAGMFLLVFALSEGGTYGWLTPVKDFTVGGRMIWRTSAPVSMIPVVIALSVAILAAFFFYERAKERRNGDPLFEFAHFKFPTYRWGLLTGLVLAMGQLGLSFVLPVFLQTGKHLTAAQNGLWLLPTGLFVIFGAQLGGRLIRVWDATVVVRLGLFLYALGIAYIAFTISLGVTVWQLLPGLAMYGTGIGFAGAQLVNVVLSQIPKSASGSASGANTTVRQVGMALGVAIIGALLTAQTARHTIGRLSHAALPPGVKANAISGVHALGSNYVAPASFGARNQAIVQHALSAGVTSGTRFALVFAFAWVAAGAVVSFLIPRTPAAPNLALAAELEPLEPLDIDPALLVDDRAAV
jgi:EmrB/QacA subfamily drug resistance transporter